MRTATRRIEFDAAHRLMHHPGKCANVHGHRYVVDVEIEGETNTAGMLADFGEVKRLVGGWVDAHWDHAIILNAADPLLVPLEAFRRSVALSTASFEEAMQFVSTGAPAPKDFSRPLAIDVMDGEPTAERMAEILFVESCGLLEPLGVRVRSVRVYETPNCWAEYRP